MKIEELKDSQPSSAWEKYQDYRLSMDLNRKAFDTALAADGTQENSDTKRVGETGECQTCKNRKYQDGSDDPGVSFKTPTKISPEQAASAVRGHEMEHVTRERSEAAREDREVVSQSVTYHSAICPECGDVYISGGTTRTTTRSKETDGQQQQPQPHTQPGYKRAVNGKLDTYA